MIAFSGGLMTYRLNRRATAALRQTEAVCELMGYIKAQIECFSLPIGDILARADRQLLSACGYGGSTAPPSLSELCLHIRWEDRESEKIFRRFCSEFGRSFRAEQVSRCAYFLSLLEDRKKTQDRELPAKKKLNSTLCLSSSLALLIFFL